MMSERTQKVEETSSNEERRKAFNPLHSSIFQNISANLLIIVAVVIVIIICVNSMGQMVRGAVAASTNEARLIQEEARLKLAVSGVSSSLSSLGAVAEAHEEYVPEIVSEIQSQEEIIQQQVEVLQGSILVTQVADGQAQLDELKAGLDSFMQGTDSAISSAQSKDIPSFNSTVEKVLAQDMSALNAAFEKVEGSIDMLVGGMEAFLNITKNSATRTAFIGLGIVILLIVLNIFLSVTRISKKIGSIADEVQGIIEDINAGRGDLTKRIQTPVNTELIFVKEGINDFLRTLQGIIKDVKDGTVVLSASSDEMTRQIHHASDNVTNTSAALEELSASMDNVAYTASGITDRLDEVRTAVDDITATAQDGNETASSIKAEASAIKEEASVKKNHTGARMQELSTVLEQSVRDSEKVRQINDLTNVILEIAAQTNLLSLNASIEAARAGEAGRGFAVVAGEISALAANSRETASKIQAISDDVTQAVNVLSANAQQVLDFINTTVIADYDAFVETGEKYENTSAMIDGMVDQFVEKADHLRAIMVDMTQAVSAITESVEESSKAISMSASNSTEIVSEFSIIDDAMDKNNEVAAQLNTSAQKFEVV